MVLWELTLATAYWLGLRKTYKLALRFQRRLLGRRYPRLSDFMYRRTRNIFDVALTCHKKIQKRDIAAGRSLGNYILRMLDRMKPTANISGSAGDKTRAAEGKISSFLVERENKQADRGQTARTRQTSGRMSGIHGEAGNGKLFVSRQIGFSHFGLAIRNKIAFGLGRFKPGPEVISAPGMALRLWWQPIRQNMEALHAMSSSAAPGLHSLNFSLAHHGLKGSSPISSKLVREDIAAWMRA